MSEYSDCRARSSRLSQARDILLANGQSTNSNASAAAAAAAQALPTTDDMEIYVRWLVAHVYSLKSFVQAMKIIEWSGYIMSIEERARDSAGFKADEMDDDMLDDDIQKQASALLIADESSVVCFFYFFFFFF